MHKETRTKRFWVQTLQTGESGREIENHVYEVTAFLLVIKEIWRYQARQGDSEKVLNKISHRRQALTSSFFKSLWCTLVTAVCKIYVADWITALPFLPVKSINWILNYCRLCAGFWKPCSGRRNNCFWATEESFPKQEAQMVFLIDDEDARGVSCL